MLASTWGRIRNFIVYFGPKIVINAKTRAWPLHVSLCVCLSVCHNYLFSQHKQLAASTRSCHPTNLHAISSRTLHSSTMASLLLAWSTTLPSCQAANQLSEVTNCKLRQHCYDSFCNQQLSSDGKSAQWASKVWDREMGKGRIAAAREEEECEGGSRLQFINACGHRHFFRYEYFYHSSHASLGSNKRQCKANALI